MKKVLCFGLLCLALLPVSGCRTMITTPYLYTNNTNTKFEVLGEVVYESGTRIGYSELLRAARNLYPDCDYVIDVMIDQKVVITKLFFWEIYRVSTYAMRGTAIKYLR